MSTTTEDRDTDQRAIFSCATSPSLELIIEPADTVRNARGTVIDRVPRAAVKFHNFQAEIEGAKDGKSAFVNGRRQPIAYDELIQALEKHPRFGSTVFREEERDEGIPIADLREELATADPRRIAELLKDEQEGPNRPVAIAVIAEAALERSPLGQAPTTTPPLRPDSAGTHQPEIAEDGSHSGREPGNPAGVLPVDGEGQPRSIDPVAGVDTEFPDDPESPGLRPDSAGSDQPPIAPDGTHGGREPGDPTGERAVSPEGEPSESVAGDGSDGDEGDDGEPGDVR